MTLASRQQIHALMVRFADGDRGAFRSLFDALWPALLAITSRGLPDRADAEDAAQRALLVVFRRIVNLDRDRDGMAWAATIAAFEVMTTRRARQRRREDADRDQLVAIVDAAAGPDEHLARSELRAAVHDIVGDLPERDRDASDP